MVSFDSVGGAFNTYGSITAIAMMEQEEDGKYEILGTCLSGARSDAGTPIVCRKSARLAIAASFISLQLTDGLYKTKNISPLLKNPQNTLTYLLHPSLFVSSALLQNHHEIFN
jgi:hypothetical protein